MTDNRLPVYALCCYSLTKGNTPQHQKETVRSMPVQDKRWRMTTNVLYSLTLKENLTHQFTYLMNYYDFEIEIQIFLLICASCEIHSNNILFLFFEQLDKQKSTLELNTCICGKRDRHIHICCLFLLTLVSDSHMLLLSLDLAPLPL